MGNIQTLVHLVSPLVEPLHDAFGYARHQVGQLGIAAGDRKRWLRTAHYRGLVFDYLIENPATGWILDEHRHAQNGAVHLAHADEALSMRVLREAPTRGGVPCAGTNTQRRAFYRNRPHSQLALWGEPGTQAHNLLTLWDENDDDIALRLVRPLGPGNAGRGVPVDLSVDLPRTQTDFEATEFAVFDEDLHLPTVDVYQEEGSGSA